MKIPVSFLDAIFQVLIVFIALFILDFIQPKSPKTVAEAPKPRAEFIITTTWDAKLDSDVDLWAMRAENPKSFTFYKTRENDVFILHNDNTSREYGKVQGQLLKEARETMTIEKCLVGNYHISLHGFRIAKPTKVRIEVVKTSPFKEVYSGEIILTENQVQVPVFEFETDKEGKVIRKSSDPFLLRKIELPQ